MNSIGFPKIFDGATIYFGSDSYACTIIDVISDKKIVIQRDNSIRKDKNGLSENQEYDYKQDPAGDQYQVTLRKNNIWLVSGSRTPVIIGIRKTYIDPSF